MRVAVLCGGWSAEREVSLRSGAQVAGALGERGHEVEVIDLSSSCWEQIRGGGFDCVFVALHGRPGEDGTVQGMLELLGVPYTGSGVLASALCMDKAMTNRVLRAAGLAVPEFEELEAGVVGDAGVVERLASRYGFPLVIKPVRQGSTLGLTVATDPDQLASGLALAGRYDQRIMVQRFVAGTEVTVGVLATPELQVLPSLEITYDNPTYDYEAKYTPGKSRHVIPARIPPPAAAALESAAATAARTLGCEGAARIDFIVSPDCTPWVLEVNTVPGLTELSLLPDAARAAGVTFEELCERLIRHGVERHRRSRAGP